ncbi:MAG: DUF6134 family protein [Woeseia sp.]
MRAFILTACLLIFSLACIPHAGAVEANQEWQFRVLLDGKPIGTHNFALQDDGDRRLLKSDANFEVKFLFFSAYRYQHYNREEWSNGCLRDIEARTVTNGKEQEVIGEQTGDRFVIEKPDDEGVSASCVMTFAYWNPEFLKQPRLLNPQTGEYLDVNVEPLGSDTIQVRGNQEAAQRYRITAKNTDLEVWYSQDNEWLALESVAKGGRKIRYELI